MIRLFVKASLRDKQKVALDEGQIHYLLHVMRQKVGDSVLLFNGKDGEWKGAIETLNKKEGLVRLDAQTRIQQTVSPLILCPALIKKENMDWVFQKATELGVSEIFPLVTERTVVSKLNVERAQSIVTEAAEQCERLSVPIVHAPVKLKDLWAVLPPETQVVCLAERSENQGKINDAQIPALCVGPEGGWTKKEIHLFGQKEAAFWHFGRTILRAETASVVAMVCFQK